MFSINDTVMYGRNGACTVKDIRVENFSGSEREYYILTPESEPNSTVYVPVDSAHIKLKRLVTKEEIADILRDGRRDAMAWQEDNRLRRESSAQIIKSCDHRRLVALIRLYRTKKKDFEDNNKKFFLHFYTVNLLCLLYPFQYHF